jgi:hypothetical protein
VLSIFLFSGLEFFGLGLFDVVGVESVDVLRVAPTSFGAQHEEEVATTVGSKIKSKKAFSFIAFALFIR